MRTDRFILEIINGHGGNTALTVFGQFMRNIYEDENITHISENDVFKHSSFKIKNQVDLEMDWT